jgi:hypothetical protein
MKKVPDTHHLHKRGGAWYYRRRVPKHLQAVIGTPVIQVSLNTASKKAAIKLREIRDVEWSAKFAKVEADLKGSATTSGQTPAAQRKALTEPVAIELVQQYVEETDKRRRDSAVAHPPLNSEERLEAEQNTQIELAIARDRAPAYDHEEVISSACHEIFSSVDLAVDETTYPSAELFDLVKRACIELEKRALARTRDDHRHHFFDRLFDPKQPSAVTVSDLAGQFMTLKGEEALAFKVARPWFVSSIGMSAVASAASWLSCRQTGPRFIRVCP